MGIKVVHKDKNFEFVAITPLRLYDEISEKTLKLIETTTIPFIWISYSGNGNVFENTLNGLNEFIIKFKKIPKYIIKIDNDIVASHNWLNELYNAINNSDDDVAWVYNSFSYVQENGYVVAHFPPIEFDKERLLKSNYISSNSMFKLNAINDVGGFVTDKKYERLLDWALYIKLINAGYRGQLVREVKFNAIMSKDSVSARSKDDYLEKYLAVKHDFIDMKKGE